MARDDQTKKTGPSPAAKKNSLETWIEREGTQPHPLPSMLDVIGGLQQPPNKAEPKT